MELLLFSFNTFKLMKIKVILEIESYVKNPNERELFKLAPCFEKEKYI